MVPPRGLGTCCCFVLPYSHIFFPHIFQSLLSVIFSMRLFLASPYFKTSYHLLLPFLFSIPTLFFLVTLTTLSIILKMSSSSVSSLWLHQRVNSTKGGNPGCLQHTWDTARHNKELNKYLLNEWVSLVKYFFVCCIVL